MTSQKKFIFSILIIIFIIFQFVIVNPLFADTNRGKITRDQIDTVAASAMVADLNSDRIFWEKNPDDVVYLASLTKIMTAIIALENIENLNETVKISGNAAGSNFSSIHFKKNDEITLEDLLKAALISSNNNATIAIAEYMTGSEKEFVKLMNAKAKELGATNTNFENSNGLDSENPGHKSTARDIIKIAKYCMKNPKFRELVGTKETEIYLDGRKIVIDNTNSLLDGNFIKGIKTGYTNNAGFCLLTYSEKNNIELLCIILGSSVYGRNYDALRLINWVYDNYEYEKVIAKQKSIVKAEAKDNWSVVRFDLFADRDINILLNSDEDRIDYIYELNKNIKLPVYKNKEYGSVAIALNGIPLEEIPLYSLTGISAPIINVSYFESTSKELVKWLVIFTLSFYFLTFAFIIIKNLIRSKQN